MMLKIVVIGAFLFTLLSCGGEETDDTPSKDEDNVVQPAPNPPPSTELPQPPDTIEDTPPNDEDDEAQPTPTPTPSTEPPQPPDTIDDIPPKEDDDMAPPTPSPTPSVEPPRTPDTPDTEALFPLTDLWGEDIHYRTPEEKTRNFSDDIAVSDFGDICYIHRFSNIGEGLSRSFWESRVVCRSRKGDVFLEHRDGETKDLIFRNDGSVIIVDLIKSNTTINNRFNLILRHFSNKGELLIETILNDEPQEEELYLYTHSDGEINRRKINSIVDNNTPLLIQNATAKIKEVQGKLYLLAYTYGVKLYHINDSLQNSWDTQVVPAHSGLWRDPEHSAADFTISDSGDIFVAFELSSTEKEDKFYNQHFNRHIETSENNDGIVVDQFSSEGQYKRSLVVDHEEYREELASLVALENKIWLGANILVKKENAAGGSADWDILLASIDLQSASTDNYHIIDFKREDVTADFTLLSNNNFLFSGKTDFDQADTYSQTSYGSGTILEVDTGGNVLRHITISRPRDISILSIAPVNDDEIIFAGEFDAAITHTCEDDYSLCSHSAMVGSLNLNASN